MTNTPPADKPDSPADPSIGHGMMADRFRPLPAKSDEERRREQQITLAQALRGPVKNAAPASTSTTTSTPTPAATTPPSTPSTPPEEPAHVD